MPITLEKITNTTSLKPRFVSKGKTKEDRERIKRRNMPRVRATLLKMASSKEYALMMIDYNRAPGVEMDGERRLHLNP